MTRAGSADGAPRPAWRPRWMPGVLVIFAIATAVLIGSYWTTNDATTRSWIFTISRVLSVLAFTVGAVTSRRGFRRDWLLMAAGIWVWAVGDVSVALRTPADGRVADWVVGGVLSLVAFVLMGVGIYRLARRDGFVKGSFVLLDGSVFAIATALVWWALVGQEMIAHRGPLRTEFFLASILPLGDVILLVAASAVTSSRNAHGWSSRALVLQALAALVGDLGFGRYVSGQTDSFAAWVPVLWMVQFALAAAAAMLSGHVWAPQRQRMSILGLVLVVTAVVSPMVALVVDAYGDAGRQHPHLHPGTLQLLLGGTLAMVALVTVRILRLVRRMERRAVELEQTARTDELTRLPNRRAGARILDEAIAVARECDEPLSVAVVDLDHFKDYNDAFGHQQGDRLLRAAGRAWIAGLAGRGTIYRYGGEEFVVVLPGHTATEAQAVLAHLRRLTPWRQSFSAGVARLGDDDDAETLVARADVALYAAKAAGRARTIAS